MRDAIGVLDHEYRRQILGMGDFSIKALFKDGNRRCKPNFWIKFITLRYTIWVEAGLKSRPGCEESSSTDEVTGSAPVCKKE